jgi:hypothetical protein
VPLRNNCRHLRRHVGITAAIVSIGLGAAILSPRAALAFFPDPEDSPGYITLETLPAELYYPDLDPGETAWGQVRVVLRDSLAATLTTTVFVGGPIFEQADGLTLVTRVCDAPWVGVPEVITTSANPTCARGEQALTTQMAPLSDAGSSRSAGMGVIDGDNPQHILLALSMPAASPGQAPTPAGLEGDFSLRVDATGDDIVAAGTPTAPTLAATGVEVLAAGVLAMGTIMLGILVRRGRRRTTEMD